MNYKETVEYLFNSTPVFEHVGASAYKEGLSNTLMLDKHFGHPHRKFKSIHIAGTNGKGSCSHTIAAILQSQGYRVGLYTSPHLVDFRERIRVNGCCITEEYVIDFVENERSFFEPLHPSFFELTTALAFKYFAELEVDIAVIEVGLGGRLDCTNIITPILSVITNISFDHTQFLGKTLAEIATEKAGIIKSCVPVVIGEENLETHHVFEKAARQQHAPIIFAEENQQITSSTVSDKDRYIHYSTNSFGELCGELIGTYQIKNTNIILNSIIQLRQSGINISTESVAYGMKNVCRTTGLAGRWQQIHVSPTVICDTGHNEAGWQYLHKQIVSQPCKQLRIVFGMVDDKDLHAVMNMLPPHAVYYWTQAATKRAIPATEVARVAEAYGLGGKIYHDVKQAYNAALKEAHSEDFIFIGGSSYIVADLLSPKD